MNMKRLIFYCFIIGLAMLIASCNKLKEGSSGNKKYDSLFLGISLGMDDRVLWPVSIQHFGLLGHG